MIASAARILFVSSLLLVSSLALADGPPPTRPAEGGLSGKVVETMDAGPYTYVRVSDGSREVWAAGPKTSITVGQSLTVPAGMAMKNFTSKTLQRTFPEIYFVDSLGPAAAPGSATAPAASAAPALPPVPLAPLKAHRENGSRAAAPAAGIDLSGIAKVEGGQTVADLYTSKADLAGKAVAVRGRVTKFTPEVMGKNWLHVQDSSGASGDLTVTSSAVAKVGDLVVVRGNLGVDRDFGAGYRYDIVIEDATVTVE